MARAPGRAISNAVGCVYGAEVTRRSGAPDALYTAAISAHVGRHCTLGKARIQWQSI